MYDSIFTAVPNRDNSNKLKLLVQETICSKLANILKQVSEQIQVDLKFEFGRFSNTENIELLNPALFFYYFKLKESIDSGELDRILDTINILSNQPISILRLNKHTTIPEIKSAIDSEWEKELIIKYARNDIISEFGMKEKFELVQPIFYDSQQHQISNIISALEILSDVDSVHHYSATNNLVAIKLFSGTIRAFSYQASYGNIYIRVPKPEDHEIAYYLEHVVHECAHQHLFALQLIDPVILNDKKELYDAPIRKQKRPMDGIFHACFVLSRMVSCFRKTENQLGEKYNTEFINRIDAWFNKSHDTVKEYAKLSDYGHKLFKTMRDCAYG